MTTHDNPFARQNRAAGALLVAGPSVYLLGEFIAAAAWTNPPYSYTYHFISNLGVRGPSELFGQYMLSPLAWVMNTGFFGFGIPIGCGFLLLRGLSGWRRALVVGNATLLALGGVLLALNPGSAEAMEQGSGHAIGAMAAFIGGNLLSIAVGVMHQRIGLSPKLGRALIAFGTLGLCAMVAYFVDLASGFNVLLGLVERAVVYPFLIGIVCIGVTCWGRHDTH
jgi:hypothetical membrane protein